MHNSRRVRGALHREAHSFFEPGSKSVEKTLSALLCEQQLMGHVPARFSSIQQPCPALVVQTMIGAARKTADLQRGKILRKLQHDSFF